MALIAVLVVSCFVQSLWPWDQVSAVCGTSYQTDTSNEPVFGQDCEEIETPEDERRTSRIFILNPSA